MIVHVCSVTTHTCTHYIHVHIGMQHVPVGPLTPEQEVLAKVAFQQSSQQHGQSSSGEPQITMGLSGAIQRHTSGSHVKAFSGKGHTLSSSSGHTPSGSSSSGMAASSSGALRAGPSGPGRGGMAGGAVGGRGRGRFVSGSSGSGDSISGGSRLVQRTAVKREDQIRAHDQVKLM